VKALAHAKSGISGHDHRRHVPRRVAVLVATLALLAFWVLAPQGRALAASSETGAGILPPSANPHGYSLADMNGLTATFTASGNQTVYLPKAPFQVLYTDSSLVASNPDDCTTFAPLCGLTVTDNARTGFSNTFTVKAGTMFYVPVLNADDSPPVVGTFPTTSGEAKQYVFDPAQLGARDITIQVDSKPVKLGPEYVAGPATTEPLPDGGGTHFVTVGVFINPLTPGRHTVRIQGGYFGDAFRATYVPLSGWSFLWESLTYSVQVKS
jgi:hypothetical protein